jgi:hypothetical protein
MRRAILLFALLLSCSSGGDTAFCVPGAQTACACLGGGYGTQVCKADGSGLEACLGCEGGSSGGSVCAPGDTRPCTCAEGGTGAEHCLADGKTWSACEACQMGAGGASGSTSSSTTGSGGAGGGGGPEVDCGGVKTCSVAGDKACCWNTDKTIGTCVEGPPNANGCDVSAAGGEALIKCQSALQCPGAQCCGTRATGDNGTYYTQLACAPTCADITLCDTLGEMAPDCPIKMISGEPTQTVCKVSVLLPAGYLACSTP